MNRKRLMAGFAATIGCWVVACALAQAQAPREINNSIGMKLMLIPKGTFTMGSSVYEEGRDADEEEHEVVISSPFYLGTTEVTQGQYEEVMGSNPSSSHPRAIREDRSTYPVEWVSWDEAVEFCKRLSARPAEHAAGRVYRLPTEAEWEYACRAGTQTAYTFGDDPGSLGDFAWWQGNSGGQTHPVGVRRANAWGLRDMQGNVEEWCSDLSGEYPKGAVKDPAGPFDGKNRGRIVRGGGFDSQVGGCRSADRMRHIPPTRSIDLGFRVVVSPVDWTVHGPAHVPADAGAGSLVGSGDPRWQLYQARLDRLQFIMEQPSRRHRAAEWLAAAAEAWMAIARVQPDEQPGLPIELHVHGANLDGAVVVLDNVVHQSPREIAFSPDGSHVAVSRDGKVLVFSPDGGKPKAVLDGRTSDVLSLRYSPDGARIMMTSHDAIRLWDPNDGRLVASIDQVGLGENVATFSPDGTSLLVVAGNDARLIDTATGAALHTFRGHTGPVDSVAFSPDGSRSATTSADQTTRLWDPRGGDAIAVLEHQRSPITFSPDSTRLVTLDTGRVCRLWDAKSGALVATLDVNGWRADRACYSPDGALLAVEGDRRISLLDGHTGEVRLASFGKSVGQKMMTAFSPDGSRMVTKEGAARGTGSLRDTATGLILGEFVCVDGVMYGASFTPDGSRLVTLEDDQTARIRDGRTGATLAVLEGSGGKPYTHAISPDGSLLATAGGGGGVRVWDIRGNALLPSVPVMTAVPDGAVLYRGGSRMATAGEKGTVSIWDTGTFMPLATLSGGNADTSAIALSPDGERIAAGDGDGNVRVWDAGTAEPIALFEAREAWPVRDLAFSPDGERLATFSVTADAPILRLWKTTTGEMLLENRCDATSSPPFIFSPDGAWMAMGNGDAVEIRDGRSGDLLTTHEGIGTVSAIAVSADGLLMAVSRAWEGLTIFDAPHGPPLWKQSDWEVGVTDEDDELTMPVLSRQSDWEVGVTYAIAFSPDGKRLAIQIDFARAVLLWDVAAGKEIARLEGDGDEVTRIVFSPDGSRMATASRLGTTRIWDGRIGAPLAVLAGQGTFAECVDCLAFHPDGTRILAAGPVGTSRMWGMSNADVHARRLQSRERRKRLAPTIEEWFSSGRAALKERLAAAEKTLCREDFDEAAAMVLERAAAIRP